MTAVRAGDVALVRSAGFVAWCIRLGTRSRFNHVRLVIDDADGTLEANPGGSGFGYVSATDLVVSPPMTDAQRAKIPDIARSLHGIPYGFADVAALGLAQFGITLPSVKRRLARRDRLFCSQLVDLAWQLAGYHAFTDGRPPQDVSPGDIADLAMTNGWSVVQQPQQHTVQP